MATDDRRRHHASRRRSERVGPGWEVSAALAAALADPGRIEVVDEADVAGLDGWLREQDGVGRGSSSTTRGRSRGRLPPSPWPDMRVAWSADGPAASVALRHLLERIGVPLVAHDVKPFLTARFGESPTADRLPVAFDTQIAAYLVNAALGRRRSPTSSRSGWTWCCRRRRRTCRRRDRRAGGVGGAGRGRRWKRALAAEGVDRLFAEVELPLIPILARMEAAGIALDRDAVQPRDRVRRGDRPPRARDLRCRRPRVHDRRPKQLGEILFVELGLPKGRRTKTGYSTDASVLEELRGVHPVIEPVLEWRIYTKLRSTYVEALPTLLGRRRAGSTRVPPGGGGDRPPVVVRPEPPEHPDPHAPRPADPHAFVAGSPDDAASPPTTARSSCGSSPT